MPEGSALGCKSASPKPLSLPVWGREREKEMGVNLMVSCLVQPGASTAQQAFKRDSQVVTVRRNRRNRSFFFFFYIYFTLVYFQML